MAIIMALFSRRSLAAVSIRRRLNHHYVDCKRRLLYCSLSSCSSNVSFRNESMSSLSPPRCSPTTLTIPKRTMSSFSFLPDMMHNHFTIWGASGWVLKTLHHNGTVPYWACFCLTNIAVRTCLLPLVLHSAHMAANFARVAPEIQFLVTIFQKDLKEQQQSGAPFGQQWTLIRMTMQTLGGIYKLHNIRPLAVFLSPLAQIPIFWYFSIDLRKIINGADPALAQDLTDASAFLWVPDLTEADPWFGLPVLAGALLYLNVEVAIGRQSLSGEATSKSNVARYLKDFFQTIAVFMPCFMAQQPAGMQLYLCTSFVFTLAQGAALRTNAVRRAVGLPLLGIGPPPEASLAKEFMQLKQLEQEAIEMRGDGPLLGRGVLAVGLECSFAGRRMPSTIVGSNPDGGPLPSSVLQQLNAQEMMANSSTGNDYHAQVTSDAESTSSNSKVDMNKLYDGNGPFIHGITAPPEEMMERNMVTASTNDSKNKEQQHHEQSEYMPTIPDEVMEAANRGERRPILAQEEDIGSKSRLTTAKQLKQQRSKAKGSTKRRAGSAGKNKKKRGKK